jgi:SAM-dependent methyltransferase
MNQKEIQNAIDRYNKRLDEFGVSEQALGWGSKGRAKLRYEILLSQWDINGSSVLDFGCGFGDMFEYISAKGIKDVAYTGVDINPNFIELATAKYADTARFQLKNLLEDEGTEQVDFVLSSGVFNHALDDNMGFIRKCFDKFNEVSRKGFAINFLSDKVAFKYDYTYHADPAEILNLAYKYSNNVVLRNDYMPFEFTIFVNKFAEIDQQYTVYKQFVQYV